MIIVLCYYINTIHKLRILVIMMIIKERENILCVDAAFSCPGSLFLDFCRYSAR